MSIDIEDVEQMESGEFARWVETLSTVAMQAITGDERRRLLDYIFGGIADSFQAERAGEDAARIGFDITGGEQPDRYAVVVESGTCRVEKDPTEPSGASLTLGLPEFLNLIVGRSSPVTMVMFGKIKVSGELQQVLAFQRWFDMPRA